MMNISYKYLQNYQKLKSTIPECWYLWEWSVLNANSKKWSLVILRKGTKSLNLIELRISKMNFCIRSLGIRLIYLNFMKFKEKLTLTKSKLTKLIKILPSFHGNGAIWQIKTTRSSIAHGLVSKQSPNLPIWWKYLELRGIVVNTGRIYRELGKFLMISSNWIKLDNESIIEIGENGILWKRSLRRFHRIKNHQIWLWFRGEIEDQSAGLFPKIGIAINQKLT